MNSNIITLLCLMVCVTGALHRTEQKNNEDKIGNVIVRVFDLSGGMMRLFSEDLFDEEFEAVYHTSIVIGDYEYYYNFDGTMMNKYNPQSKNNHGLLEEISYENSEKTLEEWNTFFQSLKQERFANDAYNFFENNCNNFVHEVLQFLNPNWSLRSDIINLAENIGRTNLGKQVKLPLQKALELSREAFKKYTNPTMETRNSILSQIMRNLSEHLESDFIWMVRIVVNKLFELKYPPKFEKFVDTNNSNNDQAELMENPLIKLLMSLEKLEQ